MIYSFTLPSGALNFALSQSDNKYKIGFTITISEIYKDIKKNFIDASVTGNDYLRSYDLKYKAWIKVNNNEIWHSWNSGTSGEGQFKILNFNTNISASDIDISSYLADDIKQKISCYFQVSHTGFFLNYSSQEYNFLAINKVPQGILKAESSNQNVALIFNDLSSTNESSIRSNKWFSFNQSEQRFVIPLKYGVTNGFFNVTSGSRSATLETDPNNKKVSLNDTSPYNNNYSFTKRNRYTEHFERYYTLYDSTSSEYNYNNVIVSTTRPSSTYDSSRDWYYHYYGSWARNGINWIYTDPGTISRDEEQKQVIINYGHWRGVNDVERYGLPEGASIDASTSRIIFYKYATYGAGPKTGTTDVWRYDSGAKKASRTTTLTGGRHEYQTSYYYTVTGQYIYCPGDYNYARFDISDGSVASGNAYHRYASAYIQYGSYRVTKYRGYYENDKLEVTFSQRSYIQYLYYYMGRFSETFTYRNDYAIVGHFKLEGSEYIDKPDFKEFNDWYIDSSNNLRYGDKRYINEITNYSSISYRFS